MADLDEARRRKANDSSLDVSLSDFWYEREHLITDDVELRVKNIILFYRKGKRFRGVDKESGPPFNVDQIRHNHVYEQKPDPLIMYKLFPATAESPKRLHFIAVTSHIEAFGGNSTVFFDMLKTHLGENVHPMRRIMQIVS